MQPVMAGPGLVVSPDTGERYKRISVEGPDANDPGNQKDKLIHGSQQHFTSPFEFSQGDAQAQAQAAMHAVQGAIGAIGGAPVRISGGVPVGSVSMPGRTQVTETVTTTSSCHPVYSQLPPTPHGFPPTPHGGQFVGFQSAPPTPHGGYAHPPTPTGYGAPRSTTTVVETYRVVNGPTGSQWVLESMQEAGGPPPSMGFGSMPPGSTMPPSPAGKGKGAPKGSGKGQGTQPRMAGWILKRGPKVGMDFKLRYCVLHADGAMSYAADEKGGAKGVIELAGTQGAQVRSVKGPEASVEGRMMGAEHPSGFEIYTGPGNRIWYFDAGNRNKMEAWIAALQAVIAETR